jgi:hypothetical protein
MTSKLAFAVVAAMLLTSAGVASAQNEVPVLNLQPICRGIAQDASDAGERGALDVSFARCVRSEQALKGKLAKKWSRYALADRQNCIAEATMGGLASYTNLLGCLESAREARKLFNEQNREYQIESGPPWQGTERNHTQADSALHQYVDSPLPDAPADGQQQETAPCLSSFSPRSFL